MDNKLNASSRLDQLKQQLRERMAARRPLTQQIQEERDRKNERSNYWTREIRKNWFIYFLLGVSALFTGMLGLFMGLAPYIQTNPATGLQNIVFNDDLGHVFTAALYVLAFITITEGAFLVGKWKYHTREENNNTQSATMILVMVLAFISILGTGIAGGSVVASTLGFLSEFREIPTWAQDWAVRIIPILFAFYAVLFSIYWLASNSAKMERIATQERQAMQHDHDFTMEMLELTLKEEALVAEADALINLVRKGKLSMAEYEAARRAKLSIPELEEHLGRDLDDDQKVGFRPALPDKSKLAVNSMPWGCSYCGNRNPGIVTSCLGCGAERLESSPVYTPPPGPLFPRDDPAEAAKHNGNFPKGTGSV